MNQPKVDSINRTQMVTFVKNGRKQPFLTLLCVGQKKTPRFRQLTYNFRQLCIRRVGAAQR